MPESSPARTVVLLGATGLVGGWALRWLVQDPAWGRVVTLGRRPMDRAGETHRHHVVEFRDLDAHAGLFRCDALACCLGTTIKAAGSQEAFRFVDHGLPLAAARLAHAGGARQMALVTAYGASAGSRIFYNRVKGEVERDVRAVGFEALHLFRPSLLTGDREENRPGERLGEAVLGALSPLLLGPLRPLRPTAAEDVALAMGHALRHWRPGVHVHGPVEITEQAHRMHRAGQDFRRAAAPSPPPDLPPEASGGLPA